MTATSAKSTVRRAVSHDLPFIRRAIDAMPYDVQASTSSEIVMALDDGSVMAYIAESEEAVTLVAVQRNGDGSYAQFGGLYREGSPSGLLRDCRNLLGIILPDLANDGVRHLGLHLNVNNPLMNRLHRLYTRLGFSSSAIVMSAEIGDIYGTTC